MGNTEKAPTRFRLDVDLTAIAGDPTDELSRVLRYWAGNMKHYDLAQPSSEAVYDSEYREIGNWTLT